MCVSVYVYVYVYMSIYVYVHVYVYVDVYVYVYVYICMCICICRCYPGVVGSLTSLGPCGSSAAYIIAGQRQAIDEEIDRLNQSRGNFAGWHYLYICI